MGKRPRGRRPIEKVIDETIRLKRPRRGAKLREEVWKSKDGEVVRYNLAYINPAICARDNGRVLGYDNSHGHHHRHFMGREESVEFRDYESLAARFREEVWELWRREHEESNKGR